MLSIDNRAGNVLTTVAVFTAGAAILYMARGALLILLLSLFFAYLLEPSVAWVQQRLRLIKNNRTSAIAIVYLVGALMLGSIGYGFGPHVVAQVRNLNAAVPEILGGLYNNHSLGADQQLRLQDLLARHRDLMTPVVERVAASTAYVAASAIWLFAIPILAIFLLQDG